MDTSNINTWVFDLDQTLYSYECGLFPQIEKRMTSFVMEVLGLPHDEARARQKEYFQRYGTTLKGMMIHHQVDADRYLDFVHDVDYSVLQEAPVLREHLKSLPGRKLIFTAASRGHSDRTLEKLGINDLFNGDFDIVDANFAPKPQQEAYDLFFAAHAIDGARSIFFEDTARNLKPAKQMGMKTVHILPTQEAKDLGLVAQIPQDADDFIDESTSDITAFLAQLNNA